MNKLKRIFTNIMKKQTNEINETEIDAYAVPYNITSVCKADLLSAGYDKTTIDTLSEWDMEQIAYDMADAYLTTQFWIDLEIIVDYVLEDKEVN